VQAGFSILWTLLALALMVGAHRRALRAPWMLGAGLLGLTVLKLFVIDLSNRGGSERIVVFIAVGLLMLVVGWFAPLPPAKAPQLAPGSEACREPRHEYRLALCTALFALQAPLHAADLPRGLPVARHAGHRRPQRPGARAAAGRCAGPLQSASIADLRVFDGQGNRCPSH
jgi:hypothetical protein